MPRHPKTKFDSLSCYDGTPGRLCEDVPDDGLNSAAKFSDGVSFSFSFFVLILILVLSISLYLTFFPPPLWSETAKNTD